MAFGASGQFALIGTHSSSALMIAGGLLAAVGLFQLIRSRPR